MDWETYVRMSRRVRYNAQTIMRVCGWMGECRCACPVTPATSGTKTPEPVGMAPPTPLTRHVYHVCTYMGSREPTQALSSRSAPEHCFFSTPGLYIKAGGIPNRFAPSLSVGLPVYVNGTLNVYTMSPDEKSSSKRDMYTSCFSITALYV